MRKLLNKNVIFNAFSNKPLQAKSANNLKMSLGFEIAGHSSFTWSVFLTQFQSVFELDRNIDAPKRITHTIQYPSSSV